MHVPIYEIDLKETHWQHCSFEQRYLTFSIKTYHYMKVIFHILNC